ncbi:type II secretion system F family protein [Agromyces sp. LHK192]|uniref:type II secretion system F family protein n=1 Tax=Agromyces sp. LHK192 TaxID=2498704 RepID=UPI000FDAA640|nr:type II secretion system F family protein [Agromyces sp. LHK192]
MSGEPDVSAASRVRRTSRAGGRSREAAGVDRVAGIAERVAVLMGAGVPATAAWRNLAAADPADRVLAAAASAASEGDPVAPAIDAAVRAASADAARPGLRALLRSRLPAGRRSLPEGLGAAEASGWQAVAAAWSVASATGAPLAIALNDLAGALRDEAQLRREVQAALAGPLASARLVTALPIVAVGFGVLLGFDSVGVLVAGPVGWTLLAAGGALLWAGARWNRALVARADPAGAAPGIALDLLAIAMSSGASVEASSRATDVALRTHLPGADRAARDIAAVVEVAATAGAPVADLLRAEAHRRRRAARAAGATRTAALGVRLMLPLGACILPAFVLLGVAPLMISVVTGTLGGAR